jgi:hypothetical protein
MVGLVAEVSGEVKATAPDDLVGEGSVAGNVDPVTDTKGGGSRDIAAEVAEDLGSVAGRLAGAAEDDRPPLEHDISDNALGVVSAEAGVDRTDGVESEIDAVDAAVEENEGEGLAVLGRHWAVPLFLRSEIFVPYGSYFLRESLALRLARFPEEFTIAVLNEETTANASGKREKTLGNPSRVAKGINPVHGCFVPLRKSSLTLLRR